MVNHHRFAHDGDLPPRLPRSRAKIGLLEVGGKKSIIETAERIPERPADGERGSLRIGARTQTRVLSLVLLPLAHVIGKGVRAELAADVLNDFPARPKQLAAGDAEVGIQRKPHGKMGQTIGVNLGVGIEEKNKIRLRSLRGAPIIRAREAPVIAAAKQSRPRVALRHVFRAVVSRAVIDDPRFKIRILQPADRVEARADPIRAVIEDDDDLKRGEQRTTFGRKRLRATKTGTTPRSKNREQGEPALARTAGAW